MTEGLLLLSLSAQNSVVFFPTNSLQWWLGAWIDIWTCGFPDLVVAVVICVAALLRRSTKVGLCCFRYSCDMKIQKPRHKREDDVNVRAQI